MKKRFTCLAAAGLLPIVPSAAGAEEVTIQVGDQKAGRRALLDDAVVAEIQEASARSVRYGVLSKRIDAAAAVDRSFNAAVPSQ